MLIHDITFPHLMLKMGLKGDQEVIRYYVIGKM